MNRIKEAIKFTDVDGTPIKNQRNRPLVVVDPEVYYPIASVETDKGAFPVLVRVEDGTMTTLQFEKMLDSLKLMFTISENDRFSGDFPLPRICNDKKHYSIRFILDDFNSACKHFFFTIYEKE